jgi:FG-GAP-like repeat
MLGTSSGSGVSSWSTILGGMSSAIKLRVGDFTGDGKADIVAVESEGNGKYRYMLGTSSGSGVSSWSQILGGMSEPRPMSTADFTGDGKADIVAVESEGNGKYRYMLGTSSGSGVSSWKSILSGMSAAQNMSTADFTGDGKADIVAVESEGNGKYRYMLGTSSGSGVSSWSQILGGMSEPRPMSTADFTGDGKADIVAVESEGNGKYRYMLGTSSGSGVSSWKQVLSGISLPQYMWINDFTGDGKADIVAVESEGNGKYRYMLGTSSGSGVSSWSQILSGISEPKPMSVADFTGDGKADIVSVEKQE